MRNDQRDPAHTAAVDSTGTIAPGSQMTAATSRCPSRAAASGEPPRLRLAQLDHAFAYGRDTHDGHPGFAAHTDADGFD
ncbi:MAG: hypothetical protein V3T27_01450 [Alphaproteobacteria bacterium]